MGSPPTFRSKEITMKKILVHAKQRTNNLPARHLGQSCTSSRGTYVYFKGVERLFRVDHNNRFESVEFAGSREAILIEQCKNWMPGVSRWAYNQLQGSKLRMFDPKIVVESNKVKIPSSPVPLSPNPSVVKPARSPDFASMRTFARQCGVIKVVLVLKKDGSPRNAEVFHLSDGKALRCRTGSKGQQQTVGQLLQNKWKSGSLGESQFASILELLNSESENASKKAA
ncbi:MAG: hypothetical protein KBC69_01285 [Candidatus Magasanikbacteria bacterium]|nr:hypothetical protein [Candidatus Magasanikbacteria bacterium]